MGWWPQQELVWIPARGGTASDNVVLAGLCALAWACEAAWWCGMAAQGGVVLAHWVFGRPGFGA